jgi:hypothetical protein
MDRHSRVSLGYAAGMVFHRRADCAHANSISESGMMAASKSIAAGNSVHYQIVVQGSLGERSNSLLPGMLVIQRISPASPITVLSGELASCEALLDLLIKLHCMNMLVLEVRRLEFGAITTTADINVQDVC